MLLKKNCVWKCANATVQRHGCVVPTLIFFCIMCRCSLQQRYPAIHMILCAEKQSISVTKQGLGYIPNLEKYNRVLADLFHIAGSYMVNLCYIVPTIIVCTCDRYFGHYNRHASCETCLAWFVWAVHMTSRSTYHKTKLTGCLRFSNLDAITYWTLTDTFQEKGLNCTWGAKFLKQIWVWFISNYTPLVFINVLAKKSAM